MDSRAVLVLGMHRSGTSIVSRGLAALAVFLGDNFFATQPDNPTGYWEDKAVVEINQRILEELRLKWDDTAVIPRERFAHHRIRLLQLRAIRYLKDAFASAPIWGFKDPRTIRLLPFWPEVIGKCGAADAYVLAIRHPLSVATSLFRRQEIPPAKAQHLWLLHNVPFLHAIAEKPLVVVDYDLLARAPQSQLNRIARRLALPAASGERSREIERFAADFLDPRLRHSVFSADHFDTNTAIGRLAKRAYLALYELATDRREADTGFWTAWSAIREQLSESASKEIDRPA